MAFCGINFEDYIGLSLHLEQIDRDVSNSLIKLASHALAEARAENKRPEDLILLVGEDDYKAFIRHMDRCGVAPSIKIEAPENKVEMCLAEILVVTVHKEGFKPRVVSTLVGVD